MTGRPTTGRGDRARGERLGRILDQAPAWRGTGPRRERTAATASQRALPAISGAGILTRMAVVADGHVESP